ncbi:hypothetical protein HK097_006411 [Rhizophlyctis rosea]|uniref:Uncharacterized protein n=1 Tax=Rhizophlyctis rosea TaxID=64517 RepID=A0AAD5SQR4_9FUNG|nr:hypothetical protein HK097_006411 [Rhizophlyctis rosea]
MSSYQHRMQYEPNYYIPPSYQGGRGRRSRTASEAKLQKLAEYTHRLREALDFPTIRVSEASRRFVGVRFSA